MPLRPLSILALALVLLVVCAGTASAQLPDGAGNFVVDMPLPGDDDPKAMEPDCTPSLESIALTGGTATCTMRDSKTGDTANGTVTNTALATTDAAFGSGTMTRTCDWTQDLSMKITFAAGAVMTGGMPKISMQGQMTLLCTWSMTFADAQKSGLEGTMEMNAKLNSQDVDVTGPGGGDIEMTFKVYVTKGTGFFDGYVGSGDLTQEQALSLLGGAGGMDRPDSSEPPPTAPTAAEQAVCAYLNVPSAQCSASSVQQLCSSAARADPQVATLCGAAGRRLARAPRQAAGGDALTLNLVKSAGAVRILGPLPLPGTKAAKVKAKTKVKLVATIGAVCTVRASTGRVVGKGTSKSSSKAFAVRAKAGAYKGAKWIQATCTLGGQSFTSTRVKVKL